MKTQRLKAEQDRTEPFFLRWWSKKIKLLLKQQFFYHANITRYKLGVFLTFLQKSGISTVSPPSRKMAEVRNIK